MNKLSHACQMGKTCEIGGHLVRAKIVAWIFSQKVRGAQRLPGVGGCRAAIFVVVALVGLEVCARAQDVGDLTASELLERGREAFQAGEWESAAEAFRGFLEGYGSEPSLREVVERHRPLLALCLVRLDDYGAALGVIEEALGQGKIDHDVKDELLFWRGICAMQVEDYEGAQEHLRDYFTEPTMNPSRRSEAFLLYGALFSVKGDPRGAVEFFGERLPRLWESEPEVAGRGVVFLLHSLLESDFDEEALALVIDTYPKLEHISQIVSFQSLALKLGGRFLERGNYYGAIQCIQRIWPKARLEAHQASRISELKQKLEILAQRGGYEHLEFQLKGTLRRVEREMESFREIENFDSALRLRLATAYRGMERYREAALVLEDMLVQMKPDEIVEQASLSLLQCWMTIGRHDKAIEAAGLYLQKFDRDDNEAVPQVYFIRAQAMHESRKLEEAEVAFGDMASLYSAHELAPRALFMCGISQLSQDKNEEAIDTFRRLRRDYPDDGITEDSFYWEGMALSFLKEHEACIEHMEAYLERHGEGGAKYGGDAAFRIVFSRHAMAYYADAIEGFEQFLAAHPGSAYADEARLLMGDALFAIGEIEVGIEAYRSIGEESTKFYEDGWFKIGKAFHLRGEHEELREHFRRFVEERPGSGRVAEAVYQIGASYEAEGDEAEAERIYWETVESYGDEPEHLGIEDILMAARRLYRGDGGLDRLLLRVDAEVRKAVAEEKRSLKLRLVWARGHYLTGRSAALSQAAFLEASRGLDPKVHSPRITIDCADALRETGNVIQAGQLYTEMRRWHPRAVEKDRAFYGLALIALGEGRGEEALGYLDRFERETMYSGLTGKVKMIRAQLLWDERRYREAFEVLDEVLEGELPPRDKAEALMRYGELLTERREWLRATAYYERVYVAYGRFSDLVASAYAKRAELLERLKREREAGEVWGELARRQDLADTEEAVMAREWMDQNRAGWRGEEEEENDGGLEGDGECEGAGAEEEVVR
jgi:tetratricopeptide (TPR) repeat protein